MNGAGVGCSGAIVVEVVETINADRVVVGDTVVSVRLQNLEEGAPLPNFSCSQGMQNDSDEAPGKELKVCAGHGCGMLACAEQKCPIGHVLHELLPAFGLYEPGKQAEHC